MRPFLSRTPGRAPRRGFSLLEVMVSAVILVLAAMAGVAYVSRGTQQADWVRDKVFAQHKALSILAEMRGWVEGTHGDAAADLDRLDDGTGVQPVLTVATVPDDPDVPVPPEHPLSGNVRNEAVWKWWRQISVRPYGDPPTRDRRFATVRVFRRLPSEAAPGTLMAEASGMLQTFPESFTAAQVYDLYVIAIDNCPGWWVPAEGLRPYMLAAVQELESKNPGLGFRIHWISKLGYGRDEEYVPFSNEERFTTDETPWTYVYPGMLPYDVNDPEDGPERYYEPGLMGGRLNMDGVTQAQIVNGYAAAEPFVDTNGNGRYDRGEPFTDLNGNWVWDANNPLPYAMADMHNASKRWVEEKALFDARVKAGLEKENEPTLRLLLDAMIAEPERFHNAIVMNMHGELIPLPPVRNFSDAAKIPERRPGWRAVTHPERLRPTRVTGNDALSEAPRFRVYAWKNDVSSAETLTTQAEPFVDVNGNGVWDPGEPFEDWNGNGVRDDAIPITIVIEGGDFTWAPNDPVAPSIVVRALSGGIDADGDGAPDPYQPWRAAPRYPETFTDTNGNGIREVQEPWFDVNGNGVRDDFEPWQELDGNGVWTTASEVHQDANGDGRMTWARPQEPFTDVDGNGRWDAAEPFYDADGDGKWTPPTNPRPYQAWNPAWFDDAARLALYIEEQGEPWLDLNGNGRWDDAEPFTDLDGNGVWDGGFRRGEMWYELRYDAAENRTVLTLHGTPLEAPLTTDKRGLAPLWRLYDLDYVPCPTPNSASAGADPFQRDLYDAGDYPKNTARWTIELPLAAVRRAFETTPGARDGDARDRILRVETRFGTDLTTGTLWPVRNEPTNQSATYAYFYGEASRIPFSERYQFVGDARHSPYADTAKNGTSFADGYNWWFVKDFQKQANSWRAFESNRMAKIWMDRCAHDVPRYLQWVREAMGASESVFTNLNGFSFFYLSIGGDVGYDKDNALATTPMHGLPFGLKGIVNENTFIDEGTGDIKGSIKYARGNVGDEKGFRTTGAWWARPWIGELWPDEAYATQWAPSGNLRAGLKDAKLPQTYRMVKREMVPKEQLPKDTVLVDSRGELGREGCVSYFLVGSKDKTFHHKDGGTDGFVVDQGFELGSAYGFPLQASVKIKHPFGLVRSDSGGHAPDFFETGVWPHWAGAFGPRYYSKHQVLPKDKEEEGSSVVRHTNPAGDRAARIVVTALQTDTGGGARFFARYSILSVLHTFLAEGVPGTPRRIAQVPRIELIEPTIASELDDPASIPLRWKARWERWDGEPYTQAHASDFAEDWSRLVFAPLYSSDNGVTWRNMLDDSEATLGVMPATASGNADPLRTLRALNPGGTETWVWPTPREKVDVGTHLIRLEVFREGSALHHAHHMEKIHVER